MTPSPALARSTTWQTATASSSPAMTIAPGTIVVGSRASSRKVHTYPVSSSSLRSAAMSTMYTSALLPAGRRPTVPRIVALRTQRTIQIGQLRAIGAFQTDGEVRTKTSRQKIETCRPQTRDGGQVDDTESDKSFPQQDCDRLVERDKDRHAEQRIPVERPSACGPQRMRAKLLDTVPSAAHNN